MAKKNNVTSNGREKTNNNSRGQLDNRKSIGDKVKAWQPVTDRTTTPPKGNEDKKK